MTKPLDKFFLWIPQFFATIYFILFLLKAFNGPSFAYMITIILFSIFLLSFVALGVIWPGLATAGFLLINVAITGVLKTYQSTPEFLSISVPLLLISILYYISENVKEKTEPTRYAWAFWLHIIYTIVMFAYAIAAIQFISGRQIEPAYT